MSKVWLITGAARGLGYSIVNAVLNNGDYVVATARNTSVFSELKEQYPEHFTSFELDVTNEQQAQDAVNYTLQHFGRLDVLVNNAGYGEIQPFEHVSSVDFRAQVETNLFGVVNMTRAAFTPMLVRKSEILNGSRKSSLVLQHSRNFQTAYYLVQMHCNMSVPLNKFVITI